MKIAVMVKQVPDTSLIEIDENGNLRRDGVPSALDPFSFFALRMAVRARSELGGTVTAVTMGPQQANEALVRCLEYGADDAVLLNDRSFAGSDTWATAKVLSEFVKKDGFDLVFCGMQAADGETAQVPGEMSVILGAELASYVTDMEFIGGKILAYQNYDGDERCIEVHSPAVISVSKGALINESLPSIDDFLEAKKKNIVVRDRIYVGLGIYSVGLRGSHTIVVSTATPIPAKKKTIVVDGTDPTDGAKALLEALK